MDEFVFDLPIYLLQRSQADGLGPLAGGRFGEASAISVYTERGLAEAALDEMDSADASIVTLTDWEQIEKFCLVAVGQYAARYVVFDLHPDASGHFVSLDDLAIEAVRHCPL